MRIVSGRELVQGKKDYRMKKILVWTPRERHETSKEGDKEDNLHRQLLVAAVVFVLDHLTLISTSEVNSGTGRKKMLKQCMPTSQSREHFIHLIERL